MFAGGPLSAYRPTRLPLDLFNPLESVYLRASIVTVYDVVYNQKAMDLEPDASHTKLISHTPAHTDIERGNLEIKLTP